MTLRAGRVTRDSVSLHHLPLLAAGLLDRQENEGVVDGRRCTEQEAAAARLQEGRGLSVHGHRGRGVLRPPPL